jgi:hypothetical protein
MRSDVRHLVVEFPTGWDTGERQGRSHNYLRSIAPPHLSSRIRPVKVVANISDGCGQFLT